MSIGGAILRTGERREAWFARADDALYRAKQAGRNRLEIDGVD
ncbi:MAG: diguanylate cyclase domain-containing protein [Silanimonas sp.]